MYVDDYSVAMLSKLYLIDTEIIMLEYFLHA